MNQRDKKIKTYLVELSEFSSFLRIKRLCFFIKRSLSSQFCSFVFLILLSLFLRHMKHSCSRLCIWTCLLLDQPLLSGLLLHTTIYAENDTHCITLQILGLLSLIPCAFFLSTNVPTSKHKYQKTKYQPHLYGNPYTKRHKCGLI